MDRALCWSLQSTTQRHRAAGLFVACSIADVYFVDSVFVCALTLALESAGSTLPLAPAFAEFKRRITDNTGLQLFCTAIGAPSASHFHVNVVSASRAGRKLLQSATHSPTTVVFFSVLSQRSSDLNPLKLLSSQVRISWYTYLFYSYCCHRVHGSELLSNRLAAFS